MKRNRALVGTTIICLLTIFLCGCGRNHDEQYEVLQNETAENVIEQTSETESISEDVKKTNEVITDIPKEVALNTPFYGIWIQASQNYEEIEKTRTEMESMKQKRLQKKCCLLYRIITLMHMSNILEIIVEATLLKLISQYIISTSYKSWIIIFLFQQSLQDLIEMYSLL